MGPKDNCGTLLQVILGAYSFNVHGNVDASQLLAEWDVEAMPTSGKPMFKMTRTVPTVESLDIAATVDDLATISLLAESRIDLAIGFVTASFVTFMGAGRIKVDKHSHADNKLPITLLFSGKPIKVG